MNHWEKIVHVKTLSPIERVSFYSSKKDSGCWEWIGCRMSASPANSGGFKYGRIGFNGKNWLAHRFSWVAHRGEIPNGQDVLHKCDNPYCVNPEHLFLGTQLENIQDINNKERHAHGITHASAKLNDELVREIRSTKGKSDASWARDLGLTRSAIRHARSRLTWRHIP